MSRNCLHYKLIFMRLNNVFTCALVPTAGRVGAGFAYGKARARDGVRCKTHVMKTDLDRRQEGEIAIIRLSRIAQQLYASFR